MNEFNYKIEVCAENGEVRVSKTIGSGLCKVILRAIGNGNELFTDSENAFNNAKAIMKEYTNIKCRELNQLIEEYETVKKSANEKGIEINLDAYNDISFIELFYLPVISLTDTNDKGKILNVLYVPRRDSDDCFFEIKRIVPEYMYEDFLNMYEGWKEFIGDDNGVALDVLKGILNRAKERGMNTYILTDESGLYKIGRSRSVEQRVDTFKCGNPTIKKVREYKGDFEATLHKRYADLRVHGEWFKLTELDINEIDKMING